MSTLSVLPPQTLRAGDSWSWSRSLPDYPATDWTLTYTLINSSAKITITGSADESNHSVSVSAATTAAYSSGRYDWTASVSDGTDVITVGYGRAQILPNLAAASTLDNRSHAQKMLDAIEAALEGRATAGDIDILSGALGSRSYTRDPEKLLVLRDRYKAEVSAEKRSESIRNGLQSGRRIQTRLA